MVRNAWINSCMWARDNALRLWGRFMVTAATGPSWATWMCSNASQGAADIVSPPFVVPDCPRPLHGQVPPGGLLVGQQLLHRAFPPDGSFVDQVPAAGQKGGEAH